MTYIYIKNITVVSTWNNNNGNKITFRNDGKTAVGGWIKVATLLEPHNAIPMKNTAPFRRAGIL